MPFIFYDTETTGTNTSFDQILQFAAIRTDDDLNEQAEFEIRCRLMPHVVPSAGALLVTGMTIDKLIDPSLPSHHQMICECRKRLSAWSPATFLGYNSISFDERMLRQAFYQNLHPIYLTNTRGNARQDLLSLVRTTMALAPEALVIPTNDKGKPVLKLDQLAPANGFEHSKAHDALGDVQATIYLCRLIRERAPTAWDHFLRHTKRQAAEAFFNANTTFFALDTRGNSAGGYFGHSIGSPPGEDRTVLYFDLAHDPDSLKELDDEEFSVALRRTPKRVRQLKTNAGPVVLPLRDVPAHLITDDLSLKLVKRRAKRLASDIDLRKRIIDAHLSGRAEFKSSSHVEDQIYDGFWSTEDEALAARFHQTPWEDRLALVSQFEDKRLRQLARRLVYVERPDTLPESHRRKLDAKLAQRMLGSGDSEWLCLTDALVEVDEMLAEADERGKAILPSLRAYILAQIQWAESVRA